MEETTSPVLRFLEGVGQYGKTSLELLKLRSIEATAEASSWFLSRLISLLALLFFVFSISVAAALWLGELLGKGYYGFLVLASFYGLLLIILVLLRSRIRARLADSIITSLTNIP